MMGSHNRKHGREKYETARALLREPNLSRSVDIQTLNCRKKGYSVLMDPENISYNHITLH